MTISIQVDMVNGKSYSFEGCYRYLFEQSFDGSVWVRILANEPPGDIAVIKAAEVSCIQIDLEDI